LYIQKNKIKKGRHTYDFISSLRITTMSSTKNHHINLNYIVHNIAIKDPN